MESAIAAFEKAHPEFSYVEEGAATAAMTPGADAGSPAEPKASTQDEPSEKPKLAGWLQEERDAAPAPEMPPPPAPAPFWVPRHAEPELTPIPFAADDSASRRASAEPMHDDDRTQQIPLAADYAALGRPGGMTDNHHDDDEDETSPPLRIAAEEHTAEIPIMAAGSLASAGPAAGMVPTGVRRPEEVRPVPP